MVPLIESIAIQGSSPVFLEISEWCVRLSAALAALRPRHNSWQETVPVAKAWLSQALAQADSLEVGEGIGPVHHFHEWW